MKESEAKTKWCPMVRYGADAINKDIEDGPYYHAYRCIGSDCMMWRQQRNLEDDGTVTLLVDEGYCGLTR